MSDDQFGLLVDRFISEPVHEIECPRCSKSSIYVDDCVYCGGMWMIPLSRIQTNWMELQLVLASRGDRPQWMASGIYHLIDPHTNEITRWLVSDAVVCYLSPEQYFAAWERRKKRREESAVMKFAKKIFNGDKNDS